MPDLSGGEAAYYTAIQEFNARSRNIKVVFINQFGFCRDCCGMRMPTDMEFMDIRKGSDVEFGQSIYEPFGIAQIEPLSFGGICVLTNVCGCAGFVRDVTGGQDVRNVIIADYTDLDEQILSPILRTCSTSTAGHEIPSSSTSARKSPWRFARACPKSNAEVEEMIQAGYDLAKHMSWDAVVENYLLKSLNSIMHEPQADVWPSYSNVA